MLTAPSGPGLSSQDSRTSLPRRAFTLVEIIVVIVVVAALGAIVAVAYNTFISNAREAAAVDATHQTARSMQATSAIDLVPVAPMDASSSPTSPQTNLADLGFSVPDSVTRVRVSQAGSLSVVVDSGLVCSGLTFDLSSAGSPGVGTVTCGAGVAPGSPTGLSASAGDSLVDLSWSAPADVAVEDYFVSFSTDGSTWEVFNDGVSGSTSAQVTGLVNGTSYTFRVVAANLVGSSTPLTASATPFTVPGAPSGLVATPSAAGTASLSWSAPLSSGGRAVSDYQVEVSVNDGGSWSSYADAVSSSTSASVSGLVDGLATSFRVRAVNAAGPGPWSGVATTATVDVPGAPTNFAAVGGDAQVSLSWDAVPSTPAQPVTGYRAYNVDGPFPVLVYQGSALAVTVKPLQNGTLYSYRVATVGPAGEGPNSNVAAAVPDVAPVGPSDLAAVASDGSVSLSWVAPLSNGGTPVSNYLVEYDSGSGWTSVDHPSSTDTGLLVSSLVNGTSYSFRVAAVNAALTGPWSSTVTATPITAPATPSGLAAVASDGSVSLSWDAVASSAAAPVSGYRVTVSDGVLPVTFQTSGASFTASGLSNGSSYSFMVAAYGPGGQGLNSASVSVVPDLSPSAPTALSVSSGVVVGSGALGVSWAMPVSNGGTAVTGFVLQYREDGAPDWLVFPTAGLAGSYTLTGLSDGTVYQVRVAAVNAAGTGAFTLPSSATPVTVPPAPAPFTAVSGDRQVSLSWPAVPSSAASPVSGYRLTVWDAGIDNWVFLTQGDFTSFTATGLSNGTSYTYAVAAYGSGGVGLRSLPAAATPNVVPLAPTSLVLDLGEGTGSGTLAASWSAPAANGGTALTGYEVTYRVNGTVPWSSASHSGVGLSATITGLSDGTAYDVRVRAVNSAGPSTWSATAVATPVGVPSAPGSFTAVGGNGSVSLSWSEVASTPGQPVTGYRLFRWNPVMDSWGYVTQGSFTSFTDTGLDNGVTYQYVVVSYGTGGVSTNSGVASAATYTVPDAPASLATTASSGAVLLSWVAPYDGGSAVTNYLVDYDDGSGWASFAHAVSSATSLNVSALSDGTAYDFRVRAVNAAGLSSWSSTVSSTPISAPLSSPTLSATPGDRQVSLSWIAVASSAASPVTGYRAYRWSSAISQWVFAYQGPDLSSVVSSLVNGTSYSFRVSATGPAGEGPVSSTVVATPNVAPGAPTDMSVNNVLKTVSLSWTAPSNDGTALTGYVLERKSGTNWVVVDAAVSPAVSIYTITGLGGNTTYTYRLTPVNAAGSGPATEFPAFTTPATPSASASVTMTAQAAGSRSILVSWAPIADPAGAPITGYTITWGTAATGTGVGTKTFAGTSSTLSNTVTGLSYGAAYYFRVLATNGIGNGSARVSASSVTVTDVALAAPTGLSASPGAGQVSLSWSEPAAQGTALTDYVVQYDDGSGWANYAHAASSSASITVSGLSNGTSYDFRVAGVNGAGTGAWSATVSATPFTTPLAPSGLAASPGTGYIDLSWDALSATAARPLTGYVLYKWDATGGVFQPLSVQPGTSYRDTDVVDGGSYEYELSAYNDRGEGAHSASITVVAASVPGVPSALSATPGAGLADLSWSAPSDGGLPITNYLVEYNDGFGWSAFSHAASSASSITVTGLSNGTSYSFHVRAVNAVGTGDWSSPVSATPVTVPDAPVGLSTSNVLKTATLYWSAPPSDGGSPILNYVIKRKSGANWTTVSSAVSASATSYAITGLAANTTYTYRITAITALNPGDLSATNPGSTAEFAPFTTPTTPGVTASVTMVQGAVGSRAITVSWSPIADPSGAPITGYTITWGTTNTGTGTGSKTVAGTSATLSNTVSGLTNGAVLWFRVLATNDMGNGSARVSVSPVTVR